MMPRDSLYQEDDAGKNKVIVQKYYDKFVSSINFLFFI